MSTAFVIAMIVVGVFLIARRLWKGPEPEPLSDTLREFGEHHALVAEEVPRDVQAVREIDGEVVSRHLSRRFSAEYPFPGDPRWRGTVEGFPFRMDSVWRKKIGRAHSYEYFTRMTLTIHEAPPDLEAWTRRWWELRLPWGTHTGDEEFDGAFRVRWSRRPTRLYLTDDRRAAFLRHRDDFDGIDIADRRLHVVREDLPANRAEVEAMLASAVELGRALSAA